MQWAASRKSGFTIVELLIVIVVIAILAAITIVGYNGMQQRTVNTARIATARNVLTLVQAYAAENGRYPVIPANPMSTVHQAACIGTGWPVLQGDPVCWNIFTDEGARGASTFPEVTSVNEALSSVGSVPRWPEQNVYEGTYGSGAGLRPLVVRGITLVNRTDAGNGTFPPGYSLAYLLSGPPATTECGIVGAIKAPESTDERHKDFTVCVLPLPTM